jgi:hypothetical protein
VAGPAVAWERTHTAKTDGGVRLWVPMIDGTARLGVVAVDLPSDTVDDDVVAAVEDLAGLAAVLVITKGHYTDAIEHVRPIGLGGGTSPVNEVVLERGDALLFYTDGVTEGGARGGERFGLDRLVDLLGRTLLSGMPPAELLCRLVAAVLEHTAYELHDDTTLLLVQRRDGKA